VTWVIEGDIKACFDTINHKLLLTFLSRYADQPTIELVRKFCKAGYVEKTSSAFNPSFEGLPQGGIISPILCNLYMHALDIFISENLIPKYNFGLVRGESKDYKNAH